MDGWRGRLGLVVPSANTVNEPEFYRFLPKGVSLHTSRMRLEEANVESLSDMTADIERCGELLGTANVDVVAYGCTTGSLFKGVDYPSVVEQKLSQAADAPAISTANAVRNAFDTLGGDSVAVTTPYTDELNDLVVRFIEESGFEVTEISGLGLENGDNIVEVPPEKVYEEALNVDATEADILFISCTGYRTFDVIEYIESDLNLPVVSSNQATLWESLRILGVDYSSFDLGRLYML